MKEWIDAHLATSITLGGLCRVAGIGARWLESAFRSHRPRAPRVREGAKSILGWVCGTMTRNEGSLRVTGREERVQISRLAISAEATERELRLCAFALLNDYLTMHQVFAEHLRLPPVELLILIATTTGNVQRALRSDALPESIRGSRTLPPGLAVPMSRRAIARVTGLPTETVRRHVESMVKRGILEVKPKGVHAPNRLKERWVAGATLRLVEAHAACTERLIALGVLAPRPTRPQHSKRA